VKRKNKGASKLGPRTTPQKKHNLKYYNIVTDLQRKPKVSPRRLCCDFWNSEIVKSNLEPSDASNLAISKFGRTNTGSVISEEESSKNEHQIWKDQQISHLSTKFNSKNVLQNSRYTKTDATRTDTKSYKKTYSRDNSLSSNMSNCFSKKRSLPRRKNSRSGSSK
jgi:hypothetical protein